MLYFYPTPYCVVISTRLATTTTAEMDFSRRWNEGGEEGRGGGGAQPFKNFSLEFVARVEICHHDEKTFAESGLNLQL